MDSLQLLKIFIRVIELGSFSATAREMNISQPTVSKMIAALERGLAVRLLERTTTSLNPTEEGRRFYLRSKGVIEEYAEAVADVRGQINQLSGMLRVNAPVGLGELRLNSLFLEFLGEHRQIEVELILSDRQVNLVEEGVDLAIRLGIDPPLNAIARKIAISPRLLVASPEYLSRAPEIHSPEDLKGHNFIHFAGINAEDQMVFLNSGKSIKVSTRGCYSINSSIALRQCFLEGIGVGTAPAWLVQDLIDSKALVQLLPEWSMPSQALHLIYPSRRYFPLRARTLLNFLGEKIPSLPGFHSALS